MFWYDLCRAYGNRDDLEKALDAIGMADQMPKEPTSDLRLQDAQNETIKIMRRNYSRNVRFDVAKRTREYVTWTPTETTTGHEDKKALTDQAKPTVKKVRLPAIWQDSETGDVHCDDPSQDVYQTLVAEYQRLEGRYDHRQCRWMIQNVVAALGGLSVRTAGGIYYVPNVGNNEQALMDFGRQVLESLGGSAAYIQPIYQGDDMHRSAQAGAMRNFGSMYTDLLDEARGFFTKAVDGKITRDATLKDRLAGVKQLREKMDQYKELLALRTDDMERNMDALRDLLGLMLDTNIETKALRKVAKDSAAVQEILDNTLAEAQLKAKELLAKAEAGQDDDAN
jgi:hypothetical protein